MPEDQIAKKNDRWFHRTPELERGSRFPSLAPEKAEKLFDEILGAGEPAISGIIDGLNEVDDGKDWKARFVLGALASYVGSAGREERRKSLEQAFIKALQGDRPAPVKTFLVMQLQWFAGAASAAAIAAQLGSDSNPLIDASVATLVAIGDPGREALGGARKKAVGHALTAIEHAL